jgi:hypothetical protein
VVEEGDGEVGRANMRATAGSLLAGVERKASLSSGEAQKCIWYPSFRLGVQKFVFEFSRWAVWLLQN